MSISWSQISNGMRLLRSCKLSNKNGVPLALLLKTKPNYLQRIPRIVRGFLQGQNRLLQSYARWTQREPQEKRELVEAAEALKDSIEWTETTNRLIELQAEWKKVGPVARKYSDDLWKKFTAACDTFFKLNVRQPKNCVSNMLKNALRPKSVGTRKWIKWTTVRN